MQQVTLLHDGNLVLNLLVRGFRSGQEPDGTWRGSIDLTRNSGELERLAAIDPVFWIVTIVNEPDGARSTYTYPEATVRVTEAGEWTRDKLVDQRLSFICKDRIVS